MLQTQQGLSSVKPNSAYSGFNTTLAFSGSDVLASVGPFTLDAVSFLQLTPQQMMTPVYSIFESQPAGFLEGNELIRGVIGLNMRYLNYFESLATLPATKMFAQVLENGVVNVREMVIEFRGRDYEPAITLNDVYIFGGSLSANVEGTPIQVVHEFVASSMLKEDIPSSAYYDKFNTNNKSNTTQQISASTRNNIPGMKPLQGKSTTFSSSNSIGVQPDGSINMASDNGYFKMANLKASNQDAVRQYMNRYANTNLGYYTNGMINTDGTQNAVLFDSNGNNINTSMIRDGVAKYNPNINIGAGYNNYMKTISTQ